jgi:hypothetical protein
MDTKLTHLPTIGNRTNDFARKYIVIAGCPIQAIFWLEWGWETLSSSSYLPRVFNLGPHASENGFTRMVPTMPETRMLPSGLKCAV